MFQFLPQYCQGRFPSAWWKTVSRFLGKSKEILYEFSKFSSSVGFLRTRKTCGLENLFRDSSSTKPKLAGLIALLQSKLNLIFRNLNFTIIRNQIGSLRIERYEDFFVNFSKTLSEILKHSAVFNGTSIENNHQNRNQIKIYLGFGHRRIKIRLVAFLASWWEIKLLAWLWDQ